MNLIFDFNDRLMVDWWMITKEWETGTDEYPVEHRTIWWFLDYDEGRAKFNELEKELGLERDRTWSRDGRVVFIVSEGENQ